MNRRTTFSASCCLFVATTLLGGCDLDEEGEEFGLAAELDADPILDQEDEWEQWEIGPGAALSESMDLPAEEENEVDEAQEWTEEGLAYAPLEGEDPQTEGARLCSQNNDCWGGCSCTGGTCSPGLIGPPPPAWHCDLAPERACTSSSDCRSGCACSGGICLAAGISPANPSCHLPPPDAYEYDSVVAQRSSYVGPQIHNFHDAADKDWVAVYFGPAGNVHFRTHNLTYGTDTKIKVFTYENQVKGDLVGVHDDVGGWFFTPDSFSSRVDLDVPANSLYLIKIINKSDPLIYTNGFEFPTYTFEVSYN